MATASGLFSLIIFIISAVTGLLIFTRGFLLNRVAITNSTHASQRSILPPQYTKVVVIVVDALRYDFVVPQQDSDFYYHNKLPFVNSLLADHHQQTRLFKFIADPPTTTMQRLKGLTTGGLPTFVDAGSNFASSEIGEDNIIQQLKSNNKSIVFMGDDTWESLFSGKFTRSYPFPSFNVQDLHTVDQGVRKHLLPEIAGNDYSLLIAHFLGVDHCGHRYGPDHPEMADKLAEMNEIIRSVVEAIDKDTLLVVLGDHGMTRTGDHGGDSELEVNAALLLHTKRAQLWSSKQEQEEVSQIDLVPTLSLLLGVPIPYSNLGSLIPEVMYDHKAKNADQQLVEALNANQQQISNYLHHYNQISNDLPKPEMAVLSEIENSIRTLSTSTTLDTQKLRVKYTQYMRKAKQMCQSIWAKFDNNLMLIGCLQVLFTAILHTTSALGIISPSSSYVVILSQCTLTVTSLVLCYLSILPSYSMLILTFLSMLSIVCCSSKEVRTQSLSTVDVMSVISLVMLSLCSLSNSLVVHEDKVSYFIVQSVLLFIWLKDIIESLRREQLQMKERTIRPATYLWRISRSTSTYLLLSLSVILRLAQIFRGCREEQEGCEVPLFSTPLSSLRDEFNTYKNMRFWLMSVPAVTFPVLTIKRILTVRGHLNGFTLLTILATYGLPLVSLFVIVDWAAGTTPVLQDYQRIMFARVVYMMVVGAVAVTFGWPKAVYYTTNSTKSVTYNGSISSLYNYMKKSLDGKEDGKQRPLVYGLGTVYSAAYMIISTAVALVLMMIAGDGMAFSLCLLLITLYLFLDLHQLSSVNQSSIQISNVICWLLLCKYYFYSTGQQPTITSIRWDAAFHGFSKDHDNIVIPAILLFSSTFSSQVLCTLMLPLLLIVTKSCQSFYQSIRLPLQRSLTGVGEVGLAQKEPESSSKLLHISFVYLLAHLCKTFVSLCSAAILRRHLMVWKIFAPAFIYEAASFILTSLVSLVSYLLYVRISSSVRRYIRNFDLEYVD